MEQIISLSSLEHVFVQLGYISTKPDSFVHSQEKFKINIKSALQDLLT